jgi:hypothetical protein
MAEATPSEGLFGRLCWPGDCVESLLTTKPNCKNDLRVLCCILPVVDVSLVCADLKGPTVTPIVTALRVDSQPEPESVQKGTGNTVLIWILRRPTSGSRKRMPRPRVECFATILVPGQAPSSATV